MFKIIIQTLNDDNTLTSEEIYDLPATALISVQQSRIIRAKKSEEGSKFKDLEPAGSTINIAIDY